VCSGEPWHPWVVLVPEKLDLIAEAYASTSATDPFGASNNSPLEVIAGFKVHAARGFDLSVGGGAGLTSGYSAPDFRVFVGFAATAPPALDRDGDGRSDSDDPCPDDPEDFDGFDDGDGCPDPDNDGDSVLDPWVIHSGQLARYADIGTGSDDCPMVPEDRDGFHDGDGCPDPDNDGDRILDPWVSESGELRRYAKHGHGVDECPFVPEDADGFQPSDGCPDADNDRDGICDPWVAESGQAVLYADLCTGADLCPLEPETVNGLDDEDGCADGFVKLEAKRLIILERVQFFRNASRIKEESFALLNEIAQTLFDYPEIKRLRIDGHTDTLGEEEHNRWLSHRRARAVKEYLVARGVDSTRLSYKGFGEERPLVFPQRKPEDYEMNRRVEFTVLEMAPTE